MLNFKFWHNKKVLITGHTGFKGGWLSLWLRHLGAKCLGYSFEPLSYPNFYHAAEVDEVVDTVYGDINYTNKLTRVLQDFAPDIIIHLAAQALVSKAFYEPYNTFVINTIGTASVLEAMRVAMDDNNFSTKLCLIVSTDKCYNNDEATMPYKETAMLGGSEPYSSSKACAELITAAYSKTYFYHKVNILSVRSGNIIGGGDWAETRLIPDIIRALEENKTYKLIVRNPQGVRPWQFVLEPLYGYLRLIETAWNNYGLPSAWNFGPSEDMLVPVKYIIKQFCACYGEELEIKVADAEEFHEAHKLTLDCSLARDKLGWETRLDINQAIKLTALWYQAYYSKQDMRNFSVQQIKAYEALINNLACN